MESHIVILIVKVYCKLLNKINIQKIYVLKNINLNINYKR